jgi:ferredoxin-thioredoxin reductase catalytic subunit
MVFIKFIAQMLLGLVYAEYCRRQRGTTEQTTHRIAPCLYRDDATLNPRDGEP